MKMLEKAFIIACLSVCVCARAREHKSSFCVFVTAKGLNTQFHVTHLIFFNYITLIIW
jgi:hypothetical protein